MFKKFLTTTAVAGLATAAVLGGTATAAPGSARGSVQAQEDVRAGCAITRYGYTGYKTCSSDVHDTTWADGHTETFVIGTNYQVYRISASSGGWKSMGGTATNVWDTFYSGGRPTVQVINSNATHKLWCNSYSSGWSGWYAC
ncbi:hypothetical protein [Streptomyces sp. NPDC050287]|uniref:hypothetical protein n=1 Tax=Streptomyces sp. NPDC050287 TaxID=3365608 RepID=UPI00379CF775